MAQPASSRTRPRANQCAFILLSLPATPRARPVTHVYCHRSPLQRHHPRRQPGAEPLYPHQGGASLVDGERQLPLRCPAPRVRFTSPAGSIPCQLAACAGNVSQLRVSARSERVLKMPTRMLPTSPPPWPRCAAPAPWPPAAAPGGSACRAAAPADLWPPAPPA